MKKTIAILLILVIGMVGVFAAFTNTAVQTLTLNTEVAVTNAFIITGTDESGESFYDVFGSTGDDGSTTVNTRDVDIDSGIAATYLTIGTNDTAGFSLYLAAAPALSATNITSVIHYTITIDDTTPANVVAWKTWDAPENAPLIITAKATAAGAAVLSKEITVEIDEESFYNAAATDAAGDPITYSANVVFNITGN